MYNLLCSPWNSSQSNHTLAIILSVEFQYYKFQIYSLSLRNDILSSLKWLTCCRNVPVMYTPCIITYYCAIFVFCHIFLCFNLLYVICFYVYFSMMCACMSRLNKSLVRLLDAKLMNTAGAVCYTWGADTSLFLPYLWSFQCDAILWVSKALSLREVTYN